MDIRLTPKALESYYEAPQDVQKAFDKQIKFLGSYLRYPSLRAKKYDESEGIWQARINDNWRFYFQIRDSVYIILKLKKHPK